jgi:hypothetical protein
VRPAVLVLLMLAVATIAPTVARSFLANTASIMLEALPFLTASALLGRFGAFAGCGCGRGPSARSIPGALAAAVFFGIPAALIRFGAACIAARLVRHGDAHDHGGLIADLRRLLPAACLAAAVALLAPELPLHVLAPAIAFIGGALLGAVVSPCALGGVALAASLRVSAPFAAFGVLCTAGVIDIYAFGIPAACARLWARRTRPRREARASALHDSARRDGVLLPCTIAAAMIAAIVIGAPAPEYRATETTLADAFPGERIDFTGRAVHTSGQDALVRYAILCCRADARPVTLAIDRNLAHDDGRWLRASGTLERTRDGELRLRVDELSAIAPPSDPFVYR